MSEKIEERTRTKYSPSALKYVALCPCYTKDTSRETSAAAERGTLLHSAVEHPDTASSLSDDDKIAVGMCLDEVRETVQRAGLYSQLYYELPVTVVPGYCKGTLDFIALNRDRTIGFLRDWKFGMEPVDQAADNVQIKGYAIGAFRAFPSLEQLFCKITQPSLGSDAQTEECVFTRSGLERLEAEVLTAITRAESADKRPSPDVYACMYCGCKATCPALTAVAVRASGLPVPSTFEPGSMVSTKDRKIGQVLAVILEDWAKQVKRNNLAAWVEDGTEFDGFELRSRRGNTVINDLPTAGSILRDKFDLEESLILQACTMSLPKLSDILAAKGGMSKDKARAALEEALSETLEVEEGIKWLQKKRGMSYEDIVREG